MDRNRRDELLANAARLFRKKGYHATTMKDIATELAILPGSLYHHIESKEALLLEIAHRGIDLLLEQVRPVAQSDCAPETRLREIVRLHALAITDHPDLLSVLLHELKSIPAIHRRELIARRDEYDRLISGVIEEGIEQGSFRPLHPRLTTFAILGMVNWLYTWYRPAGSLTPKQIADAYLSLILHGLSGDSA